MHDECTDKMLFYRLIDANLDSVDWLNRYYFQIYG
jgi:hypothetical protein